MQYPLGTLLKIRSACSFWDTPIARTSRFMGNLCKNDFVILLGYVFDEDDQRSACVLSSVGCGFIYNDQLTPDEDRKDTA